MGQYTGSDLSSVPQVPGVYALISQNPRAHRKNKEHVIYVGMTNGSGNNGLRKRLNQHLVEYTSTAGSKKWAVQIDVSQIDKVRFWQTDNWDFDDCAPSRKAFIFEEYVKHMLNPLYSDSKTGSIHEDEFSLIRNPPIDMKDFYYDESTDLLLPSYSNLVNRVQSLEEQMAELLERIDGTDD